MARALSSKEKQGNNRCACRQEQDTDGAVLGRERKDGRRSQDLGRLPRRSFKIENELVSFTDVSPRPHQ
ncbi:MAG: hypothetical protein ACXABG_10990 [Promethearchaeota archaeon]